MTATDTHRAIDAVWRIESPRLIAGLARIVRDVGLAEDLARAFLVSEPTIAQRIVRAKRILAEKRVPFEVPRGADRVVRLSSVLERARASLKRRSRGPRRRTHGR